MSPIVKPMLAGKCERPHCLRFPVLATPKLDGIRCLKINGRALTRSFKSVSNQFTRQWIESNLPDGLDGELIVPNATFSETAGHIGRESGEPDFEFHVFDYVNEGCHVPYACRMRELERLPEFERVVKVLPVEIHNMTALAAYEERCLAEGYEGVMIRTPDSPYKCGRSTENEGSEVQCLGAFKKNKLQTKRTASAVSAVEFLWDYLGWNGSNRPVALGVFGPLHQRLETIKAEAMRLCRKFDERFPGTSL